MALLTETNRKWWLLGAVSGVLGLVLLDETVVGIALPTIQKDFNLSQSGGHWVVNAYLLSFACFVAVGGKLADHIGVLRFFLFGLALFSVCSIICGFSPNGTVLIFARAAQGLGAAIILPLFMAMITMTFPKEERGVAIALSGTVGTTFMALGPLVGGLMTDFLSWRWIFWINPFAAVVVGAIVSLTWREVPRPPGHRIDWFGLLLISSGMFGVVYALMEADDRGWENPAIWGPLAAGLTLLAMFYRLEKCTEHPLMEVRLFSLPVFSGSNLTLFIAQFAKMPLYVFVALYAQTDLKLTPFLAGIVVMLGPIPQPFFAVVCGKVVAKKSKRSLVLFGLSVLLAGFVWLFLAGPLDNVWVFAPGLLIAGVSFPFLFTPTRAAIAEAFPEHMHGQSGGIAMASQIIGGTVGLAVSSAVFALGGYQPVFAVTALLLALTLVYAFFAFRDV